MAFKGGKNMYFVCVLNRKIHMEFKSTLWYLRPTLLPKAISHKEEWQNMNNFFSLMGSINQDKFSTNDDVR